MAHLIPGLFRRFLQRVEKPFPNLPLRPAPTISLHSLDIFRSPQFFVSDNNKTVVSSKRWRIVEVSKKCEQPRIFFEMFFFVMLSTEWKEHSILRFSAGPAL